MKRSGKGKGRRGRDGAGCAGARRTGKPDSGRRLLQEYAFATPGPRNTLGVINPFMMMNNGARPLTSPHSRFLGAWWGLFVGDALALPSDGYYNLKKISDDCGDFSDYAAPREPHPHSEIHRVPADAIPGPLDCLLHRRALWGAPGTHYHHGMRAGDNTLSAVLALELARSLVAKGRFDRDDWLERYRRILLSPDGHRDFYIPAAHRIFIGNLGKGLPPEKCGEADTHIAGLVEAAPIMLLRANTPDAVFRELTPQISLIRPSTTITRAGTLMADILRLLLAGMSLDDACFKRLGHTHHPYLTFPYHRWIEHHTLEHVATHELSQGASGDDAMPLSLFIALKHADSFEEAIATNATLGGDACHRGSLVGLMLGAVHGKEGIPRRLIEGLVNHAQIEETGEALWRSLMANIGATLRK